MRILSGIQFTTHFIEIFDVETKRFVSSFVNVILMQKPQAAASARAGLQKANAERLEIIFLSEFAICSGYQNVGKTKI